QVLGDHTWLVQREITVHQRRNAGVWIHLAQLVWAESGFNIDYFDAYTLLSQYVTHPMRIMIGGIGIADHSIGRSHSALLMGFHICRKTHAPNRARAGLQRNSGGSVNVFPVLTLEQVSEHEEHRQEQQHISADALAFQLDRVCRVSQEGYQILDLLVVLGLGQLAATRNHCQLLTVFVSNWRAGQRIELLAAILDDLNLLTSH